jgi:hypothetical protein
VKNIRKEESAGRAERTLKSSEAEHGETHCETHMVGVRETKNTANSGKMG